jgi:hypothetical protein
MDNLSIKDLLKMKSKNSVDWNKIYAVVFQELVPIIKSNATRGINEFIYPVPISVLGVPLYDIQKCTEYHVKRLQELGFRSKQQRNNFIALSWRHHEPDYGAHAITIKTT